LHLEEENYSQNADLIIKHFIAEGVVSDHSILIADVERNPQTIVSYFIYVLFYKYLTRLSIVNLNFL